MKEKLNEESNNKKKNNSRKIIIIVAIICVILVGTIVFINIRRSNNKTKLNSKPLTGGYYIGPKGEGVNPAKPIIYLYPEQTTEVIVELGYPEKISCSYPNYKNGWKVIANPDSTLKDIETGRNLYSLYWEGKEEKTNINMDEGFIVKGENIAEFLEEKLSILGLTEREAEEFIIYWLPKLENNNYNYIRFASIEEINEYMPLKFSVEPDTLIRVLMQYKPLNEPIKIKEQELITPERSGFVAVEWGGTEIK